MQKLLSIMLVTTLMSSIVMADIKNNKTVRKATASSNAKFQFSKIPQEILMAINAGKQTVYDATLECELLVGNNDPEIAKKNAFKKARSYYNSGYKKACNKKNLNIFVDLAFNQLDEKDHVSPIGEQYGDHFEESLDLNASPDITLSELTKIIPELKSKQNSIN